MVTARSCGGRVLRNQAVILASILASRQCLAFALSPVTKSIPGLFAANNEGAAAADTADHPEHQQQTQQEIIDLQSQHPKQSPSQTLRSMAKFCDENNINTFDVYGDYNASPETSYLRKFESEFAKAFGMDDAVFMPSGVMAQSIVLLIHSRSSDVASKTGLVSHNENSRWSFACHRTSHLLLHEEEGYSDLLDMDVIVLPFGTQPCGGSVGGSYGVQPLRLSDLQKAMAKAKDDGNTDCGRDLSTVIIELPHRELGGKLTPWDEVVQMGELCRRNGVAFHCDGARIFEAAAGHGITLPEIAEPFDTVYVSFYKGLGAISGAMLLGDSSFCSAARAWLRRFGGNLYTLLPYAVSAWSGYNERGLDNGPTFVNKKDKLRRLVGELSKDEDINTVLLFDPKVPETNMVHGFIRASVEDVQEAIDEVALRLGVRVLSRVRAIRDVEDESLLGFGCRFEWTMGDSNVAIEDDIFIDAWKTVAAHLIGRQAGR